MINKKRVLMFGWELPPFNSGGLGAACDGLSKAIAKKGLNLTFVLPRRVDIVSRHMNVVFADSQIKPIVIDSLLQEYSNMYSYSKVFGVLEGVRYGSNLIEEVQRYGLAARKIAQQEAHDVIHAHDWLSFLAGVEAKKVSGEPLVTHVHATEFDRACSDNVHPEIYKIEKYGMDFSDKIIAVSKLTKDIIVNKYKIAEDKITVVHNGIDLKNNLMTGIQKDLHRIFGKIVLFVGRITLQKGVDYLLHAATKVLRYYHDVSFVISGSGDMQHQIVNLAAHLGISHRVFFTGFLRGDDLELLYKSASLFVLPSVSEPFGIVALEAVSHQAPVLISKQSGVSEVLTHALKVDFWDTTEMANKILAVLNYETLGQCLRDNSGQEVQNITWQRAADKCVEVYRSLNF